MKDTTHPGCGIRELGADELSMVGGGCDPFEGIGGVTVSDEEYDRLVDELRKKNGTSCQ